MKKRLLIIQLRYRDVQLLLNEAVSSLLDSVGMRLLGPIED